MSARSRSIQHTSSIIPGSSGKLNIVVLEFRPQSSSKSNIYPYVIVETKLQRTRTFIHEDTGLGSDPSWADEVVELEVKFSNQEMHVVVVNEKGENSEAIGDLTTQLSSMCVPNVITEWYELKSKGQVVGHIHIKSQWKPPKEPLQEMGTDFVLAGVQLKYTNGAVDDS